MTINVEKEVFEKYHEAAILIRDAIERKDGKKLSVTKLTELLIAMELASHNPETLARRFLLTVGVPPEAYDGTGSHQERSVII